MCLVTFHIPNSGFQSHVAFNGFKFLDLPKVNERCPHNDLIQFDEELIWHDETGRIK